MARRNNSRRPKRRAPGDLPAGGPRPLSLGTHWRADGRPKSQYASQGEALSVADERRADTGVALNAYQCEICHSWHLGSYGSRER